MIENIVIAIVAFIAGIVFVLILSSSEKEEAIEIKKIDPLPVIREEKNVVFAFAEVEIPEEYLIHHGCDNQVKEDLKNKLADEIWKYAIVSTKFDHKWMMRSYRARLQVIDNGNMNPLCDYVERKFTNENESNA